ncbi:hypothetical protein [Flavobacterium terrae]|uniref:Uncharacterized protein n=1 Tax=Flavobacterium terrae TaxID=415425 RepID=A0A1M6BFK9_9FLAO|nr:hypothetical protein [Flavobacterium terrae]SHI47457.1 hypothetical protein SAMN05444363_0727 [Flavobacterium terrae]
MKTKISLCALIVALALVSCKKELEPQESSTAVRATETPNTNKTANVTPVQQSTTQAVTTNSTQTTPAGINPPHGQPGHRCDIAVGAPLDSKPNSQTTQVTPTAQPLQIQNQTITATQPVKTAKGMNPPHGQPGHRCDIAVGAPLNSKPNSTTTTKDNGLGMTVTPANVSSDGKVTPQNTTPALLTTGNSTTEITAPGMNPAHGQPGHRCDIPVGSPLNQEKKSE